MDVTIEFSNIVDRRRVEDWLDATGIDWINEGDTCLIICGISMNNFDQLRNEVLLKDE
jgi:hypothetical protein